MQTFLNSDDDDDTDYIPDTTDEERESEENIQLDDSGEFIRTNKFK